MEAPFTVGIFSRGILRIPHLGSFVGTHRRQISLMRPTAINAVAGWGLKPTTATARAYAAKHDLPYLCLEDGFLRSVGLGVAGHPTCSMIIDDKGIYYDAEWPSRLEYLISAEQIDTEVAAAGSRAMALVRRHRLSKYNHAPSDIALDLPHGRRVLVIDQTVGDVSVSKGGADAATFSAMLEAAIADNPDATILVKTHPDVLSGKKKGFLTGIASDPRVRCLSQDCDPITLLEQVDQVYVVTSHMGFEALMLGKPVVCFGLPWYACWGLTDDRNPARNILENRRFVKRTVEHLFAAAYIQYTHYIDPDTGAPGTIFDTIRHLVDGKRRNDESRGTVYCVGMSAWKRAVVAPFLATPSTKAVFVRTTRQVRNIETDPQARILIWGRKDEDGAGAYVRPESVPVFRMEDGFLRSVGLGSNLKRPMSLVLDSDGIYYDPRTPSALENWLKTAMASQDELERAARLRERLTALKLSKYNVGTPYALHEAAKGKRVLLVPGQVEDDASLRFGSLQVQSNADLLRRVRRANPRAYIVYKPHPDVLAGNRDGAVEAGLIAADCDEVALDANIIDCINAADEVHTMTSLAGFEALLYGKQVHCYGRPFYAGWGLTTDYAPGSSRGRSICIDTLVYGALIHYPRYIDPYTLRPVSVERIVNLLESQRREGGIVRASNDSWLNRNVRKVSELIRTFRATARA